VKTSSRTKVESVWKQIAKGISVSKIEKVTGTQKKDALKSLKIVQ
jgi:hypothetical protein